MNDLERAARAVADGELVVYPTETVYGLGGDARSPTAVERVFAAKGRSREKPLSLGVPSVARAEEYTTPTAREAACMRAFLPGPVTVLVDRGPEIPDVLTAGSDRVGIRVPAHDLARDLLDATGPLTATSANVSGRPSVRTVGDLDREIRDAAAVVVDGGETQGTESTVVDVANDTIIRAGAMADAVREWLEAN